jgi:hypothetical protein
MSRALSSTSSSEAPIWLPRARRAAADAQLSSTSSSGAPTWTRFFLVLMPAALLVVGIIAEAAGWALSYIPLRQHTIDDRLFRLATDTRPFPLVLLGDSTTHNVVRNWRVNEPGEVADLTAHGDAGLIAELLLLRRFLEMGHRPKLVLLVVTPDLLTIKLLPAGYKLYTTTRFTRPDEREIERKAYPDFALGDGWQPTAINFDQKVMSRLISLFPRPIQDLGPAAQAPDANAPIVPLPPNTYDAVGYATRKASNLDIRPEVAIMLKQMCELSTRYSFALRIGIPPTDEGVRSAWQASGAWRHFLDQLNQIAGSQAADCRGGSVLVFGRNQVYPTFDVSGYHIRGAAYEQRYASELAGALKKLAQNQLATN